MEFLKIIDIYRVDFYKYIDVNGMNKRLLLKPGYTIMNIKHEYIDAIVVDPETKIECNILDYIICTFNGIKYDDFSLTKCVVICTDKLYIDNNDPPIKHIKNKELVAHMICTENNPLWKVPTEQDIENLDDRKTYNDVLINALRFLNIAK